MSEPTLKLPGNADQLLQRFPAAEPDFEAQAKAIQARISRGEVGHGLDDLLHTPDLASEAGEPSASPTPVRAAPVRKGTLADMARRSLQKKDDNAELAKELLAAAAQSRRPDAAMVERVRAASRLAPGITATGTPVPTSSREPGADDAARPSGVVSRVPRAVSAPLDESRRARRGTVLGVAAGVLAVAASVALFVGFRDVDDSTSAALAAEKAAHAPAVAPPVPVSTAPAAPGPSEDRALSPEALAAAPPASPPELRMALKPASPPAAAASSVASKRTAAAGSAALAVTGGGRPEAAPEAPVAEGHVEALAPEPKLKPAEGNTGDIPLTPSSGAVSTALSSVKSSAQACLVGQTEAVNATVTFASDGHVLQVSAGGPSSACIRAALSKARISPFARDSFAAKMVVRPP